MAEEAPIIPLPGAVKRDFRLADYAPTYGTLTALVVLFGLNIIFTNNFADFADFRNILVQVTPTMLAAIGMTFVISTGSSINLSVGSVMATASATAAILLAKNETRRNGKNLLLKAVRAANSK